MRRIVMCLLVFSFFTVAHAHIRIIQYEPTANAILSAPPGEVVITFSGSVEPYFSKIEVFNENNTKISRQTEFLENDTIMKVKLPVNLGPGNYMVKWICIGLDGHRKSGNYAFEVR